MRVTAETHRSNGAAILRAASALFRERGLDSVSVAEVTEAAGLTHGAFYGHFASKAALTEAACRSTLQAGARGWQARAEAARAAGGDGLAAIIGSYLNEQHRDQRGDGCALPLLGPEMMRGDPALTAALSDGTASLLAVIDAEIAIRRPALADDARQDAALAVLSAMTGGIVVARSIASPDLSRAALAAASRAALAAASL